MRAGTGRRAGAAGGVGVRGRSREEGPGFEGRDRERGEKRKQIRDKRKAAPCCLRPPPVPAPAPAPPDPAAPPRQTVLAKDSQDRASKLRGPNDFKETRSLSAPGKHPRLLLAGIPQRQWGCLFSGEEGAQPLPSDLPPPPDSGQGGSFQEDPGCRSQRSAFQPAVRTDSMGL